MGFILRILFSGLIVFIPSQDGKKVTVLLLNVTHSQHTSDGMPMPAHNPIFIARAGNCSGDCTTSDPAAAQILYADQSPEVAMSSLQATTGAAGVVWLLDRSELTMSKGSSSDPDLPPIVLRNNVRGTVNGVPLSIPTTSTEREDISWLANLNQICPDCTVDPAVHDARPPMTVAARFVIDSGTLFTYSVARIRGKVIPVQFKRLDGTGSVSTYSQAVATWIGASIAVPGGSVRFTEGKLDGGVGRSVTLSPDASGKLDVALLNLPTFVPPSSPYNDAPQVGKHFEVFYDITEQRPAPETRFVPFPGPGPTACDYPDVDWSAVHPQDVLFSDLLNGLRLNVGRSAYDRLLCPPTQATP